MPSSRRTPRRHKRLHFKSPMCGGRECPPYRTGKMRRPTGKPRPRVTTNPCSDFPARRMRAFARCMIPTRRGWRTAPIPPSGLHRDPRTFQQSAGLLEPAGTLTGRTCCSHPRWRTGCSFPEDWTKEKRPAFQQGVCVVRVAIQNFLKNPVISMVFGHPNRKISCISPHIKSVAIRKHEKTQ